MYEYKYVRLELKGIFELRIEEDYHIIIDEHAKDGWRLVQVLTPPFGLKGIATYAELIFEKQL